jgi:hypothetical protein
MSNKPHKGTFRFWKKNPCQQGLGFYLTGYFEDHPEFKNMYGWTSYVVVFDEENKIVETKNSIYTLGEEAPA